MEEISEINSYFQVINRGSLLYPNDTTINFVLYNFVVIDKLEKNHSFLHSVNQRKLAMHIILNVLADYELLFNVDTCDEDYNIEKIQRMFVWSSTNALLNNFCNRENNITSYKLSKTKEKENFKHSVKFCICNLFFYKNYLIFKSLYCLYLIYLLVYI